MTEEEIASFKVKPFDHQITGINYLLTHPKALLLDSMGVGKTNEIIWTAEILHRRGIIKHCLIICGVNAVKQNWKKEIQTFSNETVRVLGEKISKKGRITYSKMPERAAEILAGIPEFFLITNIESIRNDSITYALTKSKQFQFIAVDEIHKVATKTSQQGANLLKLKSSFKVGATGTLLTTSPISLYVPLAWTENDHGGLTMFKSTYCITGGFGGTEITGYKNIDMLKDELASCSIRRTLKDVRDSIPPKTIDYELIEMDEAHRKFYDAIVDGVKAEADKIELNTNNLLALTTRLRQAASCPSVLTTQDIPNSKLERCLEIIEELVSAGERIVVFNQFKETVYVLAEMLKEAGYHGTVNTSDTPETVFFWNWQDFQKPESQQQVFIGTVDKCATGINLNAASYLIMIDESWGAYKNDQAHDRIWRINNDRPAHIKIIACKDTIDERVHEVAQIKQELSDWIIDGKENRLSASMKDVMISILRDL